VAVEFCRPCPARSVVARGVVLRGVGNVDRDPDLGRVDSAPVVALMRILGWWPIVRWLSLDPQMNRVGQRRVNEESAS
jgi:hypothetical protein